MSISFLENKKNLSNIKLSRAKDISSFTKEWNLVGEFKYECYDSMNYTTLIGNYFYDKKLENNCYFLSKKDITDIISLLNFALLIKSMNVTNITKEELLEFTEPKNIDNKLNMVNEILAS